MAEGQQGFIDKHEQWAIGFTVLPQARWFPNTLPSCPAVRRTLFHQKKFQSSTVYRLHSNLWRLTTSPSVFCSLRPLFGDSFQRSKELTPWRCLFWCFHKSLQMKRWDEWSLGCPVSCWCPRTCCVASLWGTIHLGIWFTESCINKCTLPVWLKNLLPIKVSFCS